jgi:hypothetical protein
LLISLVTVLLFAPYQIAYLEPLLHIVQYAKKYIIHHELIVD